MAKNRFHSVEGEKYDFRKCLAKKKIFFSFFYLVPVRTVWVQLSTGILKTLNKKDNKLQDYFKVIVSRPQI